MAKQSANIDFMCEVLKACNIEYAKEFKFDTVRRFRFDIAIPNIKVAIEYEGINSEKSGHTTIQGYTKDCEKYNLAQTLGWKVLRYTALNYQSFYKDLNRIIYG